LSKVDSWSRRVRKPEPGKVHLSTLKPGDTAILWDGREVRVENVNDSGVTVSEEIERLIVDKVVKHRSRYVIARASNVTRKVPT